MSRTPISVALQNDVFAIEAIALNTAAEVSASFLAGMQL